MSHALKTITHKTRGYRDDVRDGALGGALEAVLIVCAYCGLSEPPEAAVIQEARKAGEWPTFELTRGEILERLRAVVPEQNFHAWTVYDSGAGAVFDYTSAPDRPAGWRDVTFRVGTLGPGEWWALYNPRDGKAEADIRREGGPDDALVSLLRMLRQRHEIAAERFGALLDKATADNVDRLLSVERLEGDR